ncbi:hypothetical protein P154DRAFT_548536 [Amniculicola lignicola CBS 123094]|uniref:Uncharacterized protein n=1 Tax=Amniculicola lignicola CBS 123094 TaxID=1392246 RepID=A0A6A5W080_9PLEO|nr:hypothetical protein P154DRAFT_548536 [Amniculicola lignicola CBS 123094]
MPDSSQATPTPRSTAEPRELKAVKDRQCPFCGQAFTSSSLGRHLDLYIREKNPKAEDGKHIAEEIRKIRGRITRRNAKPFLKKGSETPGSSKTQSLAGEMSPAVVHSPMDEGDSSLVSAKVRSRNPLAKVPWQLATTPNANGHPSGHPSGHPPRALAVQTPDVRRDASRNLQKAELDHRHKAADDSDTARATELALRELLKSVREANAKASGIGLYDFDPYTRSFPSLCLHILQAPSTLFSPTPFPTAESWSITPPGQKQFEALNRQVRERLLAYQRQRQINQLYPSNHTSPDDTAPSPLPTPPLFDPDPQKLFGHLADAYSHWTSLTDQQRQETWQLEMLRSYARASDGRREAEANLRNARREIEHLKAACLPSGAQGQASVYFTIAPDTTKELGKHGMDFRNWDYERLVDKWKAIVRESKPSSNGMAAQKPLPNPSTRNSSLNSLPGRTFTPVHSTGEDVKAPLAYSAPGTTNGAEPGSDQIDAEGEDDDDVHGVDIDAEAASDEGSMHHHYDGLPIQPTPIHPSQMSQMQTFPTHVHVQAQAQAQAHAQAQAQAHAQAQAQAQAHAQAQAQAWARQQMNQSRNAHHHSHQRQQLSPHPNSMGSAVNSRRSSVVLMDTHGMNGSMLPMEGIESHRDQFLRLGLGLNDNFVSANGDGV